MKQEDYSSTVKFSVSTGFVPWGDPSEYVHTVTGIRLKCSGVVPSVDLRRIDKVGFHAQYIHASFEQKSPPTGLFGSTYCLIR